MRKARTRLAISVLIVIAMVSSGLGVSALYRGAAPAVSGPMGNAGTRSEGAPAIVSLSGTDVNEVQEDNLPIETTDDTSNEGSLGAERIDENTIRANMQASQGMSTNGITAEIVQNEPTGTRNPGIDAGGPYGGPTCFEGSCTIHFEATTDDPTIIFYRWDFNNDGVWDTPWSTNNFYDKLYYDNYYNFVKAEGWDGISTKTTIFTGYNLYPLANYYWGYAVANVGWKFRAKVSMDATELGFYRYTYAFTGLSLRLWDFATQAQLGTCTMSTPTSLRWYWCTLSSPVYLTMDKEYMISYHKNSDSTATGYWVLFNNPSVTWDKVEYLGMHYATGLPQRFPATSYGSGTTYVPMLDFRWRQVVIEPVTQQDTAFVEVNNVAPTPFDIVTDPSPALEGTPVRMSAKFDDPGLDDTWDYRFYFGDGTFSPWAPVRRYSGGANVLLYHTADLYVPTFRTALIAMCGNFCLKVDAYNFQATPMTLAQLMAYDVIWVDTYSGATPAGTGDLLAAYMDAKGNEGSGGVIVTGRGPYNPGSWQITGRYFTDQYSPVPYGVSQWLWKNLGPIYVPGHPILDGVTTISAYPHSRMLAVNPGATRIADWTDGAVLLATKVNPKVPNGARAVAMPFRMANAPECTGDCVRIALNAIKWASRQADPVLLPMPLQLPWATHLYKDDDPVTTSPQDDITIRVEVRDDDHLKVEGVTTLVFSETFETCTGSYPNTVFPSGWSKSPANGWQCLGSGYQQGTRGAFVQYGWNDPNYGTGDGNSFLASPTLDMSGYNSARVQFYHYWVANYATGNSDGWVEASTDGGLTYPYVIAEYHHNSPATDGPGVRSFLNNDMTGSANVKIRFHYFSADDWYWAVDSIYVYGTNGKQWWGLGEATSLTAIANVPPSIVGGITSGLRSEAESLLIDGLVISDPALMEPTEWFAYSADFDDGTPSSWIYKGTLAPPKQDVLILHAFCTSGNTCASYTNIANRLLSMDLVATVTPYNWFQTLTAPSLAYMLGFDVIIFGGEWAYLGNPAYDAARVAIGNNLANYLDAHRGGVVTFMATYDLSSAYGELFSLLGRYIDQDYGPFEKAVYPFSNAVLGTIHYPDHPVMKGVTNVISNSIHSGNLPTTAGGVRLASWNDGGAAVGVKDFNNDGRKSCAINAYTATYGGTHASQLLRQCMGWVIGGLPTPEIPPVVHTWGDNGLYTVDFTLIDDDMGWTWDSVGNMPVANPTYPQSYSHHYIPVEVNNVDPTILGNGGGAGGIGAYTTSQLCIRLSGNKGNDATLTVMGTDGSYYSVTTTRVPGSPAVGCLPKVTIDMTPDTQYTLTIAYDPTGDSGANPTWIFNSEWPDGKIKELRWTFNSNDGPSVWTIDNKEFKRLMIAGEITFEATASDPGSDDLAFVWIWGDSTPYDIHIYAHPGVFYQNAASSELSMLPFKEPRFDYSTNDVRSPEYDPARVHDTAKHTFAESQMPYYLYVMLIVADDDVKDPYPSTYLKPGMDIETIEIDI